MIPKKQIEQIRQELIECQNPVFFFHDDADGLCSFLLLRRFKGEGDWRIVKTTPHITEESTRFVSEFHDKVFILDIALVDQEFVDKVKKPVIWIDHHTAQKISKAKYFNPRIKKPDEYTPVTSICYEVVKQDIWLAAAGSVADYSIPKFFNEFKKKYPELAGKAKDIEKIIYDTKLGRLIKILGYTLKGKSDDVRKAVNIIKSIKEPSELLEPKEGPAKWVYKRYSEINKEYQELLSDALKQKYEDILVFLYEEKKHSFSSELVNEIKHRIPNKKIYIVGREKSGDVRIAIRSSKINLIPILNKALEKVEGFGGGHPYACGASIKKKDFERFLELIGEYSEKGL